MQTDLFSLSNRIAIVTGSARGLGQTLAEGLARQGARVVVCDLNQDGAVNFADIDGFVGCLVAGACP